MSRPANSPAGESAPYPALSSWKADARGVLMLGGMPIDAIAERVGGTPFYAYDSARIAGRVAELRNALPERLHLHYAIKANPLPDVVRRFAELVDGADVASAGELSLALEAGFAPARIGFAGPGKTDDELAAALEAGIVIELESAGEFARLMSVARQTGEQPRVAVRVNPAFRIRGAGMHMGGGPSQFGVDVAEVPALLGEIAASSAEFLGFHLFAGSQSLNVDAILAAEAEIADCAIALAADAPAPVRHLNIGGGLGIPYFPKDRPLDLAALGRGLAGITARLAGALPRAEIILELGRYLVGEAGIYVCRVVDRKHSHGEIFLVTDGGLHQHLAATGNFGQVIRRNYPLANASRFAEPPGETVTVAGRLCTPIDRLAEGTSLAETRVGDLIAVFQSGAYGASASPQAFLGHPPCREILL